MATAATVFRDYETDGVPASGRHKPKKPDIRQLLAGYESIINAFLSNGGLIYASLSALNADLAHGANSMAWVLGDATVANNGIYRKIGGSGSGSWTRVADLPFSFIIASDVGAGTANAIQATTSIPVSSSALVWTNIFEANTSSPVTISFNGGSALTIKTNSGNNVAAGGLVAGMIVMGVVSGSMFRILNDQVSSAIVAAAEAAQAAAELARDEAQAAAAAAADKTPLPLFYQARKVSPDKKARDAVNAYAWVSSATPGDNNWLSVCWSPDLHLFVAVAGTGTGNRVMTSPDGAAWTLGTSPADNSWISVCWSPELRLFVAVASSGTGNRAMTSPDGITWTARATPADNDWLSVCWSPELSLFVATAITGTGNRVMTSPNGISWTIRTTPADNSWRSVCWSPELKLFVAVAGTGTGDRVMTSANGTAWTLRTSAADNDWRSVCWSSELRLLVAVASSGAGNRVMTSPDGVSWTARTSASDNDWRSVCWSPDLGEFIAVAGSGTGNRLMLSVDGINWSATTSAADNDWRSVCWSSALKMFVSVSISGTGNRVMTSISGYRSTDIALNAVFLRLDSRGYYDLSTDFGAPGAGSDYTTLLGSMIDACIADGKHGQIRPGIYNISAPISKSFSADFQTLEIKGFGNRTKLRLLGGFAGASGSAIKITYNGVYNAVRWRDMEIQTDDQSTTVIAFDLICPAFAGPSNAYRNEFTGLTFRGTDGIMTAKHFKSMIKTMRVNNVFVDLCDFYGAGSAIGDALGRGTMLDFQSDAGNYAVKYSVKRSKFMQYENSIRLGTYVQELVMEDNECVGGSYGILVPAGQVANDGIIVNGCHFNCHTAGIGVFATAATNLAVGSGTYFVIDDANAVGIRNASRWAKIIGCGFEGIGSPSGSAGVDLLSGAIGNSVQGNSFSTMPLGALLRSGATNNNLVGNVFDTLTTGVTLQSGANNNKLNHSTYLSVTTQYGDSGTGNSIGVATP